MDTMEGLVIRTQSGFLIVKTDAGEFTCRLRGRLKQDETEGDIAAIGDRVRITNQTDGTGMIEKIHERNSVISRMC